MRTLTDAQQEAVDKLKKLRVGALFMACGTGKTQTAVTLINSVDSVDCLYWVTPCQTTDNLKEEIKKCGCKYEPHIIGIESIGCSDRIYLEELEYIKKFKNVFFVVDESIKAKNPRAKRTSRILTLSQFSSYRLILNGTPVTKNIMDIYTQMQILSPKILNCPNQFSFRDRYCKYTQWKKGGRITKTVITGYANVDHLLSLIKPYVFTCDLQLKVDKKYKIAHWFLNFAEMEEYNNLKEELFHLYENDDGDTNLLAIFAKLQHFYSCASDKWRVLEEAYTDKSIIFCKHKDAQEAILKKYPDATVLTYGKGSFGLNLQEFNRIIYFEKTFDYSFREQSEGRIYRNGQKLDCEYIDLTGDIGLEDMIDGCISGKETLVQHFKKTGNNIKDL